MLSVAVAHVRGRSLCVDYPAHFVEPTPLPDIAKKIPSKVPFHFWYSKRKKNYGIILYTNFFFNIVNYFTRNLDKLLIGKYMGMSPLGYYEKSYRLMMLPLQNITFVITL